MPDDTRALLYRILSTEQQKQLEVNRQLDFSYGVPGPRALSRQRPLPARLARGCLPAHPRGAADARGARPAAVAPRARDAAARARARHRPDRLGQVDDPRVDGRRGQPARSRTTSSPSKTRSSSCTGTSAVSSPSARSAPTRRASREALRAALRQDPDVILLGEMRDLETIATALTAAETGHLVLATLHTQSAPSTIDRVIDVFPPAQQEQVRMQLANTLQGIVTQTLLPTADGLGRVACLEILFPDDAVRNLIRQGKVEQIYSVMQTSTQRGMQTMEHGLAELIRKRDRHAGGGARGLEPQGSARRNARAQRCARVARRHAIRLLRTAQRFASPGTADGRAAARRRVPASPDRGRRRGGVHRRGRHRSPLRIRSRGLPTIPLDRPPTSERRSTRTRGMSPGRSPTPMRNQIQQMPRCRAPAGGAGEPSRTPRPRPIRPPRRSRPPGAARGAGDDK